MARAQTAKRTNPHRNCRFLPDNEGSSCEEGVREGRPVETPQTTAAGACRIILAGDTLTDMPLFSEPGRHVVVPLKSTYARAFAALPRRWGAVLGKAD